MFQGASGALRLYWKVITGLTGLAETLQALLVAL
jgi:hypothetical protein